MYHLVLTSLKLLFLLYALNAALTLPTLGHVERNQLETYEDLSSESGDLDLFGKLTFRFSCENRAIGLYADSDYECRVFHACDDGGKGFPVICPNQTVFDQKQRICSEEEVDCERAHEWFYLNELPFSTDAPEEYKSTTIEDEVPSVLPLKSSP